MDHLGDFGFLLQTMEHKLHKHKIRMYLTEGSHETSLDNAHTWLIWKWIIEVVRTYVPERTPSLDFEKCSNIENQEQRYLGVRENISNTFLF